MKIATEANIIGGLVSQGLIKDSKVTATGNIVGGIASAAKIINNKITATAEFNNKITAIAFIINSGVSFVAEEKFNEQSFDVTNDSLPITEDNAITFLTVNFSNFNGNIDVTNQLPTNLSIGSRVLLRKIDDTIGKILFSDALINYSFINRKGEYLELFWTGTKFIV